MSEPKKPTGAAQQPAASDREMLTGLMSLAGSKAGQPGTVIRAAWSPAELSAIWRHQLKAPLLADLGSINDDANATVTLHTRSSQKLESFADLMGLSNPPVELLQLAKEFAKSQRYAEDAAFPVEIASVLYYAAIVLALLRAGQRITEMNDARLRQGVQWSLQQPWLDAMTKALFEEALAKLASG